MPIVDGTIIANISAGVAASSSTSVLNDAATHTDNVVTLLLSFNVVWFSKVDIKNDVIWPTLPAAIAQNIREEIVVSGTFPGGYYTMIAWCKNAPEMPASTYVFILYLAPKYWVEFDSKNFTVPWATLAEAIAWNIVAEVGALGQLAGGTYTFEQWYDESGHAPSSYDSFITFITTTKWYAKLDASRGAYPAGSGAYVWPTFAQAISNNIYSDSGTWALNGPTYFETWWDDSGEGRSYDSAVTSFTGTKWYSNLTH